MLRKEGKALPSGFALKNSCDLGKRGLNMSAGKCVSEAWRTGKAPHFCGLKEIGSYKGTN